FGARKHVLEYDDVMNKQREVIYAERNRILDGKDVRSRLTEMVEETVTGWVLEYSPENEYSEEWDWDGMAIWFRDLTGLEGAVEKRRESAENAHELAAELVEVTLAAYEAKETDLGEETARQLERQVMLRVIDTRWMEHLLEMDYLKEGIGLRAMGQRDPITEYKQEAFEMFGNLVKLTNEDFIRTIMHIQVLREDPAAQAAPARNVSYSAPSESSIFGGAAAAAAAAGPAGPSPDQIAQASAAAGGRAATTTMVKDKEDPYADVGRNDPCPCGSGKKYKKCHGANA
ncbi:MAG: SEC-C metal-binding domain-containing protein, partial [Actinomycetota bacterium]|nr:SEC-C metal-binding domain-containing protein [Actinomycetota bacterium]